MIHGTRRDTAGLKQQVMASADRQPFDVVSRETYGYHRRQVDEFMRRARVAYEGAGGLRSADIRRITFDAVRGGYAADQVDEVLDRLEDALAQAEREARIRAEGEEAWRARVEGSVEILRGRLERPDGQRFRRPTRADATAYAPADVDALCHRLLARLERRDGLGVDDVRLAVFGAAGPEGYEEAQVDAFLDAAIDVLAVFDD
ncbi:DivIVA domain-containing protein [Citricoccus sp. SGAir0253]|uniref:DivIVA domain-containing protein n=1 Tax=Citricoccus sp. SGAir0253 TaxID=2567881 RepID=UPI0010CCD55B|nr:DivIVA domain-containing protein [Citricoccus sp. SGAir0253]QCU78541.1 DivIVA domain-containing protein [Citricoccus sp. SGAir0253]